ncbi:GNAT family N-acetyltransferase [Pseudooceanicola sediminis]|uniref:GNAT family N-acetyltransferase n=1 Tax=Pseudooceanicola sediminis TaxID=2211117 RepID=A0A399J588_9RHOB|nr:bifunctional helix-turn-helix transcriptional regulator/GNAT family N-acetyltransferase [Pseudooceanicola sediminis]KAA2316974.1 bifunctional helix-turn-helix transcriptional regulator/GNAT family N-acetyltransferase [Puniceibacterium sp. HSS470]RII40575.1 GNAT family N-acetyltransferase [Pseudooceanicola sediminis]|tara:strand:+ start:12729 stop:13631 length:903 start_codon:yes stop_codon:yes gene_type:complete
MSHDPVARFRRFSRAVTTEVGALDHSFLGRGRPLGAARVLNAIGHGMTEVSEIRDYLGLDSSLMSRLLRSLESEGLVHTAPHPDDARRRIAHLTPRGEGEFTAYEALSNSRAQALLARHPKPQALLAAMDLVASALGRDRIALVEDDPRSDVARHCLSEYYGELGRRFARGFDVSLSRDPDAADMTRPRGTFLLALSDGLPLGCVGLKGSAGSRAEHAPRIAEVKRLWVSPAARGLGLARDLMTRLEQDARDLGYSHLRLDTNSALPEAVQLYRASGWSEIARFNDDPYPDLFFEKQIQP